MQLGDFFKSAPNAVPVNPRPVDLVCVCKGETLPSGAKRPPGSPPVRAKVTGAFVFLDGDETLDARADARAELRDRAEERAGEDGVPEALHEGDLDIAVVYEVLHRALREWDPEAKRVGGPLFPTAKVMRELVLPREANRLYVAYGEYVASEHPQEAPSPETFRGAQGRGRRVAGPAPR